MPVTVSLSDVSISGYTLTYQVINPVVTEKIYYYTSSSSTAPTVDEMVSGNLACSGSRVQTVNEETFYYPCALNHGLHYYLYIYVETANGVGSMSQAIDFPVSEPTNIVPYSYMFSADLSDVIPQQVGIL